MREFTITDITSQQVFVCREDEYVLHAMQRNKKECIKLGCKGGGCGVCRINIISGSAEYGRMSKLHVTEKELKSGYALACRVKPKSDLIFECAPQPKASMNQEAHKTSN
ncbi:ferredoxin [Alteromonas sp. KS69]|uniref:2Fe-2S iron-sulfur cluster-binding protein n=1 Tax=Alteromonas sp. KS69 TaxID=2109917 RepID=UPI000F88C3E3|nr:2Fe-2S iron-sulfur cluster-binding protein [Alteromonas sp. KS69]RUP78441.1 ferredoxin [Alteromonas sp. KS69]